MFGPQRVKLDCPVDDDACRAIPIWIDGWLGTTLSGNTYGMCTYIGMHVT